MRWNRAAVLAVMLPVILASAMPDANHEDRSAGAGRDASMAAAVAPAKPVTNPYAARKKPIWRNVINDQFSGTKVPSHWFVYNGPYGSGPKNCATPSHVTVSGGRLKLLMRYEKSGNCGAGWYTGGMMINDPYGAVDQRITVRFRVVRQGAASHYIIPMRWPTRASWPAAGEEDLCETNTTSECMAFLHYSSSNKQVYHRLKFNAANWHTLRFSRRNHVLRAYIDNMTKPVWVYRGSSTTLPDTFKRTVLQQECQSSCPSGTSGTEVIEIDWIKIDTKQR
jgi:hypothetical protein